MSTYPSPPSLRIPYDRDGSFAFSQDDSLTVQTLTVAQMQVINNESDDDYFFGNSVQATPAMCRFGVVFPSLRDITAFFACVLTDTDFNTPTWTFETSADTTSGIDGTWTARNSQAVHQYLVGTTSPNYRSMIFHNPIAAPFIITGVKGARVEFSTNQNNADNFVRAFHLFGYPSAGNNLDSLRPWHPTLDQQADGTTLDFGDMPRGTSQVLQVRFKNISATKTANGVSVTMEVLTDATPTIIGQFQMSLSPTGPWTTTLPLGTLTPGQISPVVYVRDNVNSGAQVSVWAGRLVAGYSSFT